MIEICAIIRNENDYLEEWINYHFSIGFNRIVLYDNHSQPAVSKLWEQLPIPVQAKVQVLPWEENNAQIMCYTCHAQQSKAQWTAFIDADEFIILKNHKTIGEYLGTLGPTISSVWLHWVCHSANGHWKKPIGGVMENYTKPCVRPLHDHFKTIARPKQVWQFENPHECKLVAGQRHNESLENAQLNHYFTKSYEEWLKKIARGRADGGGKRTPQEFFAYNDEMKKL